MSSAGPTLTSRALDTFIFAVGLLLGLAMLKFGNPVIFEGRLPPPKGFWELVVWAWPISWGYFIWVVLLVFGAGLVLVARSGRRHGPSTERPVVSPAFNTAAASWRSHLLRVLPWLPIAWFLWQCLSSTQTFSWPLTLPTLKHFATLTVCFYLGLFVLSKTRNPGVIWSGVLVGFIAVIAVGFDQHFGGLDATRRFFFSQPDWQNNPAELIKKISSNRIYSTLFYPNTLAGVILLFLPALIALALTVSKIKSLNLVLAACLFAGAIACLYWSGSKAGWLIAMLIGLGIWLQSNVPPKMKWIAAIALAAVLLMAFVARHAIYFEKGATSMGARLDYWKTAVRIVAKHPFLGTGPGTFYESYRYMKPPDAEMTRLVHNDYIQQASDSGIPGCILFCTLMITCIALLYKSIGTCMNLVWRMTWFGLAGWAIHSMVEFNLYIPALAWPAFILLGLLLGMWNRFDNQPAFG